MMDGIRCILATWHKTCKIKFIKFQRDWIAVDNLADGKEQRIDSEMTLVKIILNGVQSHLVAKYREE